MTITGTDVGGEKRKITAVRQIYPATSTSPPYGAGNLGRTSVRVLLTDCGF